MTPDGYYDRNPAARTCPECIGSGYVDLHTIWGSFFGTAKCGHCGGNGAKAGQETER